MEKMTFEQAIKRLEEIVDLLENNETALDDSVKKAYSFLNIVQKN